MPFNEGQVFDTLEISQKLGETYENRLGDAAQFDTRPTWELRAAIPLLRGGSVVSCMGVYQPYQGSQLEQDAIDFLKKISHHIVQSIRIHNHISSLTNENLSLFSAIQQSTLGVFLLDKNLSVVTSNNEAERIIDTKNLKIGINGKIHTPFQDDQILLDEMLNQAAKCGFSSKTFIAQGATIPIKQTKKIHPIKLTILPINAPANSITETGICIAIFANDPDRPWRIPLGYIQKVYGLTPTECTIAQTLLDKMSIELVASSRGTTLGTTRWQIKKIMEKTQTHSQAELCKLLITLSNDFSFNSLSTHLKNIVE